ncbi:Helix-turn-helix domain-containing protein [Halogranum gelatinilyticum]|uniref:Helix-turn-helix domain-containing protein n=1 Tax=Halogranum gelatinilyticum TaxID=660521 RepID=A0A1G9TMN4_9EURY|nr:winged helix-turn-helix domain-containing protein [Halogranum gelatinilyticum]SDM49036.1 Helix-turn-helix domain-containing protein [Halogranum gelatinilyticum]
MTTEWEAGTLFELLGDELARKILALTSVERLSADAISDRCDSSQPTVYRRLDELQDYDLLEEYTEYDADGNHYQTYGCRLDEVAVGIEEGTFTVDVRLRRELVDDETLDAVGDAAPTGKSVEKNSPSAAGGDGDAGGR